MANKLKKHPLSVVALKNKRTTGLLIIAVLCLNYPVLSLVNRPVLVAGIPVLYLYLFVLWLAIILASIVINTTIREEDPGKPDDSEAP